MMKKRDLKADLAGLTGDWGVHENDWFRANGVEIAEHAIERAIEAESLAWELAGMLIAVRRWVESTDVLGIVGKEGIEVHSDSVADAIDEMIIHAREVLGDGNNQREGS